MNQNALVLLRSWVQARIVEVKHLQREEEVERSLPGIATIEVVSSRHRSEALAWELEFLKKMLQRIIRSESDGPEAVVAISYWSLLEAGLLAYEGVGNHIRDAAWQAHKRLLREGIRVLGLPWAGP